MPLGEDIQLAECLETGVFLYGRDSQDLSKIQNTTSEAGQQTLKICIKRLLPGFPSVVPWMCPGPSTEPGGWAGTARTPVQAGVQFRCPSRTTRTLKGYFSSLSRGLLTWRWTPVARVAMWLWWDNDGWCQHCPRSQQWLGARPHTQHRGKHLAPLYNGAHFTHKAQRASESPPSPSSASKPSPSPALLPPGGSPKCPPSEPAPPTGTCSFHSEEKPSDPHPGGQRGQEGAGCPEPPRKWRGAGAPQAQTLVFSRPSQLWGPGVVHEFPVVAVANYYNTMA